MSGRPVVNIPVTFYPTNLSLIHIQMCIRDSARTERVQQSVNQGSHASVTRGTRFRLRSSQSFYVAKNGFAPYGFFRVGRSNRQRAPFSIFKYDISRIRPCGIAKQDVGLCGIVDVYIPRAIRYQQSCNGNSTGRLGKEATATDRSGKGNHNDDNVDNNDDEDNGEMVTMLLLMLMMMMSIQLIIIIINIITVITIIFTPNIAFLFFLFFYVRGNNLINGMDLISFWLNIDINHIQKFVKYFFQSCLVSYLSGCLIVLENDT